MRFMPTRQSGRILMPVHNRRFAAPVRQFLHGMTVWCGQHIGVHSGSSVHAVQVQKVQFASLKEAMDRLPAVRRAWRCDRKAWTKNPGRKRMDRMRSRVAAIKGMAGKV
jgi:hypothetical protein